MIAALLPVFLMLIFGLPLTFAAAPILLSKGGALQWVAIFFSPVIFCISYVLVASTLSRIGRPAVVRGTFPRDLKHPVYGPRRLYAICWTAIYYFTPLYFVCLSVPTLKKILFRLFGYLGETENTIFPDVWIRDLPLLKIGKKAYLANRATMGSNLCLIDGSTMVDWLWVGDGALVGHMALVAPGVKIEDGAELGVHTAIGIRARLRKAAKTAPCVSINHGAEIGAGSEIGACSYVGLRAKIGEGLKIPAGSNIPAGAEIKTQEEVSHYYSSETQLLNEARQVAMQRLMTAGQPVDPQVGHPLGSEQKNDVA